MPRVCKAIDYTHTVLHADCLASGSICSNEAGDAGLGRDAIEDLADAELGRGILH